MSIKNSYVRNSILLAAALCCCLLVGCFEKKTLATGKTQTVQWFKEHNAERKAVLEECSNNPGELSSFPNCKNAKTAKLQLFTGTNGPINWK